MARPLHVLIVEDSEEDLALLLWELSRNDYDVTYERVETAPAMREALARTEWEVVLSDFSMPEFSGMEALATLKASGQDLPFIVISGTVGEELAVSALKAGAHDFLVKGHLARLIPAIERELRDVAERRERRRLEGQLRQAQKMDAIGQLAGGVAHDFNNLLTVIEGYSSMLLANRRTDDPDYSPLDEMRDAARRGALLTRQLLAFSRQQVLQPRTLNLNDTIVGVEKMIGRLIEAHIEVRLALDPDLDPVLADQGQIEQVIMNLVVNARDAMSSGGQLTIQTSNVILDSTYVDRHPTVRPGPYALIAVSDTGTGITAHDLDSIFEPFFTTKEIGKGTGLGLSTVHGIVTQSNGHISVYSEPGQGTTFKVYLPRSDGVETQREIGNTVSSTAVGHETILLVEDHISVRRVATAILQRAGYTVIETDNGTDALRICENPSVKFDLVLSDMVMPGLGGRALGEHVRRLRPGTPVILMSGYSREAMVHRAQVDSGTLFIDKPFTPDTLRTKVAEALRGSERA